MKMKKMDFILIFTIILLAAIGLFVYSVLGKKTPGNVIVEVGGEVYGEYELDENEEVLIHDTNVLHIENGIVQMYEANCPDQICVDHAPISKNGETIVCLPNKVIVTITEGEDSELDAVVK